MTTPIRILLVEDSPDDAELLIHEIRAAGFDPKWTRVETEAAYLAQLHPPPDLILSDYSMPKFSGIRAFELLQSRGLDVPFILVSGTVGEEVAVQAMKQGVTDYLVKDRIVRLGTAIRHALEQKKLRDEHARSEQQIRLQANALEAAANAILITDSTGKILFANTAFCTLTGYSRQELIGKNPRMLKSGKHDSAFYERLWSTVLAGRVWHGEMANRRKDGTVYYEEMTITPVKGPDGRSLHFIAVKQDISERKRAEEVLQNASSKIFGAGKTTVRNEILLILLIGTITFWLLHATNILDAPVRHLFAHTTLVDEILGTLLALLLGFGSILYRRWRDIGGEIGHRRMVEQALRSLHSELEARVSRRTVDLTKANEALRNEVQERKRTEEQLILSRTLTDHSNDGIEVVDPETGRFLDVNARTWQRLGYTREELLSMTVMQIDTVGVSPATWASHVAEIRRVGSKVLEGTHRRKDGSTFPVEISVSYVTLDRDYLLAAVRDITERKRAEEKLHQSEERFHQLAENINEVFWMTCPSKNEMLYISPGYEKIWGRSCESLYSSPKTWLDAIHPEDRDRVLQAAVEKQAIGTYDEEYRIIRPDKTTRWIRDRAFPVLNKNGEVDRIVGVAADVTEKRKLEEEFRQSQKMEAIGQLASGVAHDFNNILAIIMMQGGMIATGGNLTPEQLESAEDIRKAAQHAANLTRQLLLFSRKQVIQPREIDLNDSLAEMGKMLRRILGEDVKLNLKYAAQPLPVYADPSMVDQVIMNLSVNARDAMPKGGELIIETSSVDLDELSAAQSPRARVGSFACICVSDTGCGIPADILPRIFEPFFTTKEVGKGTGLGLATVFGIVQQHQGWVNVYSEPGRGASFRIYLPRLQKNPVGTDPAVTRTSLRAGNETVLLVEDDPSLRTLIEGGLKRLGYRVFRADSGISALSVWNEHRDKIQLLLTDLVMPGGMTGRELAEKLKKEDPKLKVLFTSGYSADIMGRNFPIIEGVNFLGKPFELTKLADTVRNCLEKT